MAPSFILVSRGGQVMCAASGCCRQNVVATINGAFSLLLPPPVTFHPEGFFLGLSNWQECRACADIGARIPLRQWKFYQKVTVSGKPREYKEWPQGQDTVSQSDWSENSEKTAFYQ